MAVAHSVVPRLQVLGLRSRPQAGPRQSRALEGLTLALSLRAVQQTQLPPAFQLAVDLAQHDFGRQLRPPRRFQGPSGSQSQGRNQHWPLERTPDAHRAQFRALAPAAEAKRQARSRQVVDRRQAPAQRQRRRPRLHEGGLPPCRDPCSGWPRGAVFGHRGFAPGSGCRATFRRATSRLATSRPGACRPSTGRRATLAGQNPRSQRGLGPGSADRAPKSRSSFDSCSRPK